MNKTLKLKKGIGIVSIILGFLRFFSGLSSISDYSTLANEIDILRGNPLYDQSLLADLERFVSAAKILLPIEMLTALAIAILGIVLLTLDKGKLSNEPREESRRATIVLLGLAISHALVEIIFFACVPSSVMEYMGIEVMVGSLFGVALIIVLCSLGLGGVDTTSQNISTYSQFVNRVRNSVPQQINKISSGIQQSTETAVQKPGSLDDEIARLKKEIEKRKLQKELDKINEEKKKEIERLKQELGEECKDEDKNDMEKQFENFLREKHYAYNTIYSYVKSINQVCHLENIDYASLAEIIDKVVIKYDTGGQREKVGAKGHRTVVNALKRFQEYSDLYKAKKLLYALQNYKKEN